MAKRKQVTYKTKTGQNTFIKPKNPVTQLIKHIKRYGLKKTLKDWKLNFLILQTPELINRQRIQGSIAMLLGLFLILSVLIYKEIYYTTLAILAGIFLQYISLKQLLAQREALRKLREDFVEVGK